MKNFLFLSFLVASLASFAFGAVKTLSNKFKATFEARMGGYNVR